jgi:hypothetical protein
MTSDTISTGRRKTSDTSNSTMDSERPSYNKPDWTAENNTHLCDDGGPKPKNSNTDGEGSEEQNQKEHSAQHERRPKLKSIEATESQQNETEFDDSESNANLLNAIADYQLWLKAVRRMTS